MFVRLIIASTLLVPAAVALYLHIESPDRLAALCREDGIVEYSQALMYFLASLLFFLGLGRLQFRNIWYLAYALLFFAVAGEEVSWGQRILDIDTPEKLKQVNVQGELNLHNIQGMHGTVRAIGLVVIFGIFVVIPFAYRYAKPIRMLINRWRHPVSPLWAAPFTFIGFLFMAIPRVTIGIDFQLDEVGELYMAAAAFAFGCTAIKGRNPEPLISAYGR